MSYYSNILYYNILFQTQENHFLADAVILNAGGSLLINKSVRPQGIDPHFSIEWQSSQPKTVAGFELVTSNLSVYKSWLREQSTWVK